MIKFIFITSLLIIALLAYVLGNKLIGKKHKGGLRAIAFLSGLASAFLGTMALKDAHDETFLVVIGVIFSGFGGYLILMSLIASNKTISKIVEHLGNGI